MEGLTMQNSQQTQQSKHYSAYATLLDGFQSYLDAEKTYYKYFTSENPSMTVDEWCDKMYTDLINKINRVPFTSEAADRGTAFNELVDAFIKKPLAKRLEENDMESEHITFRVVILQIKGRRKTDPVVQREAYEVVFDPKKKEREEALANHKEGEEMPNVQEPQTFTYFKDITDEFVEYYDGALPQVFVFGTLDTHFGKIDLYGYADELLPFACHDIKTTKNYHAGNFREHWQHIVYPYCLHCMGMDINHFEYNVTNFKETFTETYVYDEARDVPKLRDVCERFIQFIEHNRDVITDDKVFNPLNNRHQ